MEVVAAHVRDRRIEPILDLGSAPLGGWVRIPILFPTACAVGYRHIVGFADWLSLILLSHKVIP
jgi:hypothetical protein